MRHLLRAARRNALLRTAVLATLLACGVIVQCSGAFAPASVLAHLDRVRIPPPPSVVCEWCSLASAENDVAERNASDASTVTYVGAPAARASLGPTRQRALVMTPRIPSILRI